MNLSFRSLMPTYIMYICRFHGFEMFPSLVLAIQFGYYFEFALKTYFRPQKLPEMMRQYFMNMLMGTLGELCAYLLNYAAGTEIPKGGAFAVAHVLYNTKITFFKGNEIKKENAKLLEQIIELLEDLRYNYSSQLWKSKFIKSNPSLLPSDLFTSDSDDIMGEFVEVIETLKSLLSAKETPESTKNQALKTAKQSLEAICARKKERERVRVVDRLSSK